MARARIVAVAFAATATFALLCASTLAVADATDADGDGVPDALELATQRTVAAIWSADAINISSRLVYGQSEDQFQLSYQAGAFEVSYDETGGSSSSYGLRLLNLVEWVDLNANGRIDGGEVVNWTALGSSAFGNVPILGSNSTNADGGRVYNFVIRSNSGEVTLNLTIAQRFMRLGDRVLTPMEAKLDITINHVFARPGPGLNVGIEMQMNTMQRLQSGDRSWDDVNGFSNNDGSINVTGGPPAQSATTFLTWANTAFANGRRVPANLTNVPMTSTSYDLYIGYPAVSALPTMKIVHDPTLGVESAVYHDIVTQVPELQGDLVLYVGSLAGMVVLVVATIVVATRRRKREE